MEDQPRLVDRNLSAPIHEPPAIPKSKAFLCDGTLANRSWRFSLRSKDWKASHADGRGGGGGRLDEGELMTIEGG